MRLLTGYDTAIGEWVAERIPHVGSAQGLGPYVAVGVQDDNGNIIAGCVYHNYIPAYGTCDISFAAASPRWAKRGIIKQLLAVPFEQYGCHRVTFLTPADNQRAIRTMALLGATKEGAHVGAFGPKKNALSFRLLRKDYNRLFVRKPHGQEIASPAARA
jgi:RimJ/RimL family protein N-acetyltransferase